MSAWEPDGPLPMFPLGSVLFPLAVLPLHVFEPRYRTLMERVRDGDRRFGVVLIERGSEVGGGDARAEVGCLAEVARAAELPDGRWAVLAVGRRRLKVARWLDDDPHPWAEVEPWPDLSPVPGRPPVDDLAAAVRRSLALRAELGEWDGPLDLPLPDDPSAALWTLAASAGLGPLDAQRVLAERDGAQRARFLADLVGDAVSLLELRLGEGG